MAKHLKFSKIVSKMPVFYRYKDACFLSLLILLDAQIYQQSYKLID